jgi:hypothetical protein
VQQPGSGCVSGRVLKTRIELQSCHVVSPLGNFLS